MLLAIGVTYSICRLCLCIAPKLTFGDNFTLQLDLGLADIAVNA